MIERLHEELDCALSHSLSSCRDIVKRGNNDDWGIASLVFEPRLQLQPRHCWHADIDDECRGLSMRTGVEEGFCRSETSHLKPCRLDEITQ